MEDEACALYVKTVSGGIIRALFETLKELLHDVTLVFDDQGMRLTCMDGSRTALIFLKLDAGSFERYRCTTSINCGVNLNSVFKLLRVASPQDTIVFYKEDAFSNELGITILNVERNAKTDFKLKLLDVDLEHLAVPPVTFDHVITLPSAHLQRLCRDMSILSDTMVIRTDGKHLIMECDGDIASQKTVIDIAAACDAGGAGGNGQKVEGNFSLKFLSLFCRSSPLSQNVELFFKANYPLVLEFAVSSLGKLRFALAPKV